MVTRVQVCLATKSYESLVGSGILSQTGTLVREVRSPGKCAVITDSNVGPLYGDEVVKSLEKAGFAPMLVTIPSGERSKSLSTVEGVCDQMIAAGLDRSAFVVALGGGVIGDLAGFVASIYYRGIAHIQTPTTVVAQVDSAIGGKTGVNARGGKNLIGTFHQPALVIADSSTLSTLGKREFNEGVAEIIKHAIIRDAAMLDDLSRDLALDLPAIVAGNQRIKAQIVSEDEYENFGLRALLNFGHTIGHAIEAAAGYGRFLHGEAVSLGIVAALNLSVERAGLPLEQARKVLEVLREFQLPVHLPPDLPAEALMKALSKDKKFDAGAIRFVLTRSLGSAFVSKDVTESDVLQAIENLRASTREALP